SELGELPSLRSVRGEVLLIALRCLCAAARGPSSEPRKQLDAAWGGVERADVLLFTLGRALQARRAPPAGPLRDLEPLAAALVLLSEVGLEPSLPGPWLDALARMIPKARGLDAAGWLALGRAAVRLGRLEAAYLAA